MCGFPIIHVVSLISVCLNVVSNDISALNCKISFKTYFTNAILCGYLYVSVPYSYRLYSFLQTFCVLFARGPVFFAAVLLQGLSYGKFFGVLDKSLHSNVRRRDSSLKCKSIITCKPLHAQKFT